MYPNGDGQIIAGLEGAQRYRCWSSYFACGAVISDRSVNVSSSTVPRGQGKTSKASRLSFINANHGV